MIYLMKDLLPAGRPYSINKYSWHPFVFVLLTMVATGAFVGTARAQGSRKDDFVFNAQGRPRAGATVRVCTSTATGQPCTPLAQVYSDSALTRALANPLSADGLGNYNFYGGPGRYPIEISGPGILTKQIANVIWPSDLSSPAFNGVSTTSGASVFFLTPEGNLKVKGSTAVDGSLTVGRAPVPNTNQYNQWMAEQPFKGPIPRRDMGAYMPAGGCSSSIPQVDPPTTGSITGRSAKLFLAAAMDFKNGCGIAVLGAGPTSTISAPNQGCTISSITRASNEVRVTCVAGHHVPLTAWHDGIKIAGVMDSSFDGTFLGTFTDATHFTYSQNGSNGTSSSGTATMQFGYAHGLTGASTYNYKVSASDGNGGMSAASAAFSVTNGNAILSPDNYNWIHFGVASTTTPPHMWVIYSDKGLGGAYSCVGTAFTNGYSDFGLNFPCPVFAPATPPATATAQMLNALISSGGGTTTLTLNTTASNKAITQNVYHDESSFLTSCVNDNINDRNAPGFPNSVGSDGCYIPAGNYYMNGPMATDTVAPSTGVSIKVAGSLYFNTLPWFISKGQYYIYGEGASGGAGQFSHFPTTSLHIGSSVPAGVVIRSVNFVEFSGFSWGSRGHGLWVGQTYVSTTPVGLRFDNNIISIPDSSAGGGAPVVFDNNVIGVWMNHNVLYARHDGLASIYFTMTGYNGNTSGLYYIENLSTVFKGMKIDGPGGNGTGGGINSIYVNNWVNESLTGTEALVIHDNGPNAPGSIGATVPLSSITLHNINNSDPASGPSFHTLLQENGSALGINNVDVAEANSFGGLLSCGPNTTVCQSPPPLSGVSTNSSVLGGTWGGQLLVTSQAIHAEMPVLLKLAYSGFGQSNPAWAQVLPPPNAFQVTGTRSGGLSAGTYCMVVVGKDAQTNPGLTLRSGEVCQTVRAASAINLSWQQASGSLNQAYSGFRLYYGSSAGNETNYLELAGGGNPYTYAFTSTGGNTAGTPPTSSTAYLSWLYWDRGAKSCLLCTSSGGSSFWQLGIGEANPGAGVKLAVAGGTIQGEAGIQAGSDVAFNASPRSAYNAFLPNLTLAAATYQRMTPDKAITVTRLQLVLGVAGAGCTTQSTVAVTDGANSVTLTTANGKAIYDSGSVSQKFTAAANLDIKIATAASGCTTAPQNANVTVQYRMQ